ncbi:MAG: hypothetical protein ACP5D2_02775 [Candidatus Nanoarchaeia archaeon]
MGRKLEQSEIEVVLSMHQKASGNAKEAARLLSKDYYALRGLDYSEGTIRNYWREAGLPIKSRGGPNTKGKSWKWKQH